MKTVIVHPGVTFDPRAMNYLKTMLLSVCLLAVSSGHAGSPRPRSKKGIMDLRSYDLQKDRVTLNGEWAIYWKQLITPADSNAIPSAYVPFPALWTKTSINNGSTYLPSTGYASYTLTVLLPKHTNKLALEVPDTYTCYRLFVNGKFFCTSGSPDTSEEKAVPRWVEHTEEINTGSDTLHLLLQIANFWHSKGGPYKAITIGDKEELFYKKEKDTAFDLLLTGFLFMGGVFFLGLYTLGKPDKVIFYFSLFCIAYSYRIIGSSTYVLHSLLPGIPWDITVHLEYLSLFVSVIFFSLYTMHLYPEDANKYVMWAEIWACIVLILIVIIFPPNVFTQLINPFLVVMFSVIAYAFYVYIKAARKKRLGSSLALLSTGVVLIVFVLINLQYFNIVQLQKAILFSGYISFFFLQSLILSFRFAYTLNSAKKQAEQGLIAKNDFLSTMSHEIRTPLNSVIGMSYALLDGKPREDQREQLNALQFSANNLLSIVNNILDYNKIEAGKVSFEHIEMDIISIAHNILSGAKMTAAEKGLALVLKTDPSFRTKIIGDPTRTSQVLTNLVQNAVKFTKQGQVCISIEQQQSTGHTVTLLISVTDTGIGIEEEKQSLIFERFTQADSSTSRNFGGTGLGLAICKRILELQGSVLELKSEPGKGSTFYFTQTFPVSDKIPDTDKEKNTVSETEIGEPLNGISILLVEDNEVNILVAKMFLEKWGAQIDIALNGVEALQKLDTGKHHIILMDIQMPLMDGFEATKQMRQNGVRLPILALTASLPYEVEDKVKDVGIDDIIVKPFVPADLLRTVLHHTKKTKRI